MLKKILKYSGKYKWLTLIATIMVIIAVAAQIIPYVFVAQIISPLITGEQITSSFIMPRVIAVLVCLVANVLFYIGGLSLSHISAFNTLANLRKAMQKKIENLPLGVIKDKGTGKLKKLIVDDIESLELLLAHATPEGLGNSLVPIGVFIAMFIIDWRLAIITLAVMPLGIIAMGMMMKQGTSKMQTYYGSAQKMNNTLIEYVNGMEVVKVFNKDGDSYKRYKTDILSYRDFTIGWFKVCWPWMAIYAAIFACTSLFTLPFGGMLVVNGTSTLVDLIIILCLSFSLNGPILKAMHFLPSLMQVGRKVEEIENTIGEEPLKSNNNEFKGNNNTICYNNITFSYDKVNVINNVSLQIEEGKRVALVGESGSGKSTLAKLLIHYYDVDNGNITLGGQDITDMSLEALNNKVSFVSQDQFLFNTSIYENVKVGKLDASKEEILEACKKAQCNEFIDRLENGIDSLAGDCGNQLSGGERQRVSLARAILKNAPIVVLDEATAFADPENEEKIQSAINEVVKDKTLLVIAHKLSSIKNYDKICVLDKGNIIACGKHEELLESCSLYKCLWQSSLDSEKWSVTTNKEDRI